MNLQINSKFENEIIFLNSYSLISVTKISDRDAASYIHVSSINHHIATSEYMQKKDMHSEADTTIG